MSARFSRRGVVAGVIGLALLGACGDPDVIDEESDSMDLSAAEAAVTAATPRVVGFAISKRVVNGLGHALVLGLDTDTAAPFTAEDLDAVAKALWTNLSWEPNSLRLAARDAATGEVAVDLRSAAPGLAPMGFTEFGDQGVALYDMDARYGEWKKP